MKYYIIAGEASGDLHGSNLIKGLKEVDNNAQIRAWGGDLMQQAGAEIVKHYKETAIMGFVEVLANIRKISKNFKECKSDILNYNPDVLILIDYPGFNLRMAQFAKAKGIKVFYYIAPKVWAWKEGRVKKIKQYVDKLFIIFPFEIEYFKKWGIEAIYRGNPLLDSVNSFKNCNETKLEFTQRVGIKENKEIIALLAGSRKSEIKYLLPRLIKVANNFPDKQFILACAPSIEMDYYKKIIGDGVKNMILLSGETYSVLRNANAAIISSGTASLEAALIGVPQVVCYGGNEISYQIAKMVIKLNYISLANLILNKGIFRELIQHSCTPEEISKELIQITENKAYIEVMKNDYATIREMLGGEGASNKVAIAMVEELKKM